MAIGIIPKSEPEKKETIHLGSSLYYIGLAIFFLSIAVSGILYFLNWRMEKKFIEVERALEERKSEEVLRLEKEIDGHYRRLGDFHFIIDRKNFSGPIFKYLEENTHPDVYFSKFESRVQDGSVTATGIARNLIAFDQQIKIFESSPMVKEIIVGSFERDEGGLITFPINITFKRELFKKIDAVKTEERGVEEEINQIEEAEIEIEGVEEEGEIIESNNID